MKSMYNALILLALHKLLGMKRGDAVYSKLSPLIILAESGAFDATGGANS